MRAAPRRREPIALLRRIAPAAALLLVAGCGKSPPSVTLTLDAAPPPDAAGVAYRGPPVAVPAVHVPAAIDRVEYVSQPAAGMLRVDDFARWSAPLGLLARDALVRDLTARLPAGSVLPPGAVGGKGTTVLGVTILAFAASAGGATMQVAWRTLPGGIVRQETLSATAPAGDPPGASRAFSALLGQLADRIVARLGDGFAPPPR